LDVDGDEPGALLIPDTLKEKDEVNMHIRKRMAVFGMSVAISVVIGLVSQAHATTVLWYGKHCTDETGAMLKNGALVQLIRSPDATMGTPDPVTGAPTGNDVACDATSYVSPGSPDDHFQGEDWKEASAYYICVRIWNAGDTASGTYYWDSPVYGASGILPVDIDCLGARTGKRK
jgi:hypothetical protein